MVNGDVWTDLDFSKIPQTLPENDLATLYLVPKPNWRDRGDFSTLNDRVIETEYPEYLYAGIAIYHPKILDGAKIEKFSIVPRLKDAISRNQVGSSCFRAIGMMWAHRSIRTLTGSSRSLEWLWFGGY